MNESNQPNPQVPSNIPPLPPEASAPPVTPAMTLNQALSSGAQGAPPPYIPRTPYQSLPPVEDSGPPLGEVPGEREPIGNLLGLFETLLRQPRRVVFQLTGQGRPGAMIGGMLLVTIVCAIIYGLVVGTFTGGEQLWAAPVKITVGLLISGFICLPSLYIFSCLGGARARLVEVAGLVAGLLALLTILLIGFAPVAWIFSQSTESLAMMGGLHLAFAAIACYFGMRFLRRGFDLLNITTPAYLQVWMIIFPLVVLQMTTALRPIVGKADTFFPQEKKFFLSHWSKCLD